MSYRMLAATEHSQPINLGVHLIALHALLLADLLFSARLYRLVDVGIAQPVLLGTCAAVTLLYSTLSLMRGFVAAVSMLAMFVGLIGVQLYIFGNLSGAAINLNAGFQYCWICTFIVFYLVAKDGHAGLAVQILAWYATLYVFSYLVLTFVFKAGVVDPLTFAGLIAEDEERGQRLFNYITASAFAWFYWSGQFKHERSLKALFFAGAAALAIGLSLSRVATVLVLLLSVGRLSGLSLRTIGTGCATVFFVSAAVLLYGVFDPTWNPFVLAQGDSSGAFRLWEYDLATSFLREHPWLGIGIAPSHVEAWAFVNNDYFAAGDLGAVGVWFDLGSIGLLGLLLGSWLACKGKLPLKDRLGDPLALTGCMMAAYGAIATVILYPGGATYFAVFLGLWMAGRSTASRTELLVPVQS